MDARKFASLGSSVMEVAPASGIGMQAVGSLGSWEHPHPKLSRAMGLSQG